MELKLNNIENKIFRMLCKTCYHEIFSAYDFVRCPPCKKIEVVEYEEELLINPVENVLPNSIVITSSYSSLTPKTYKESDILHIGISNSKSIIYNFWFKYNKDSVESSNIWKGVLNIPIKYEDVTLGKKCSSTEEFNKLFDEELEKNMQEQAINFPKYDQINNNCYAFICRFLNKISFQGVNDWNKETLADSILKSKVLSWEYFCYAYKELDKVITDSKNKTTFVRLPYKPKKVEVVVHVCDMCGEIADDGVRYNCQSCVDFDLCVKCYFDFGHSHEMRIV